MTIDKCTGHFNYTCMSLCENNHSRYLFVFFKNVLVFVSSVRHFYFYIIFVLKINIAFVSVNDGQNIFVLVNVTITEISLEPTTRELSVLVWNKRVKWYIVLKHL